MDRFNGWENPRDPRSSRGDPALPESCAARANAAATDFISREPEQTTRDVYIEDGGKRGGGGEDHIEGSRRHGKRRMFYRSPAQGTVLRSSSSGACGSSGQPSHGLDLSLLVGTLRLLGSGHCLFFAIFFFSGQPRQLMVFLSLIILMFS